MIDCPLMFALVIGVWGLALYPVLLGSHGGQQCEVEGTSYGEIDDNEVYVYALNATAYCY